MFRLRATYANPVLISAERPADSCAAEDVHV
jgi:hypothetical protein